MLLIRVCPLQFPSCLHVQDSSLDPKLARLVGQLFGKTGGEVCYSEKIVVLKDGAKCMCGLLLKVTVLLVQCCLWRFAAFQHFVVTDRCLLVLPLGCKSISQVGGEGGSDNLKRWNTENWPSELRYTVLQYFWEAWCFFIFHIYLFDLLICCSQQSWTFKLSGTSRGSTLSLMFGGNFSERRGLFVPINGV